VIGIQWDKESTMTTQKWESQGVPGLPSHDTVWSSRIQWGAIIAGAIAGFGVVILMSLLGAALGITAGTIGAHATDNANAETAGKAATAFGIGTAIWMILTAAAVGLVGGWVLNQTARRDRAYSSVIFAGLSWAAGNCALLTLTVLGMAGGMTAIGAGAGSTAAAVSQRPEVQRMLPGAQRNDMQSNNQDRSRQTPMTDEEKAAAADAAKKAATTATVATWVTLISQLIALAATIIAASMQRQARVRPITELRPRPVTAP